MFSNDECMEIRRAQTVSSTKRQIEILENWCKDFGRFFGWKVNVAQKDSGMIVEVMVKKSVYRISAEDNYVGCTYQTKESGKSCDLTGGEFSFSTFARIMIHILHLESSVRRRK